MQETLFKSEQKAELYCDDAYKIFDEFQKQGLMVDHIITDPPYNISKDNNFNTMSSADRQGVDFGEWDKDFDLLGWIDKYTKLLSPNGSIIIFNSYRNLSHIIDRLEQNNIDIKDVLIWQKSNPMPRNRDRRYVQDMEFAIWGVNKNAKWVFNRPESTPYLRSLFQSSTVSGAEKTEHPTQKSLHIMQEIIKIHTEKGQSILDPFMGSGSTGVACQILDRKFIGVEKESSYFDIAKSRMIL